MVDAPIGCCLSVIRGVGGGGGGGGVWGGGGGGRGGGGEGEGEGEGENVSLHYGGSSNEGECIPTPSMGRGGRVLTRERDSC